MSNETQDEMINKDSIEKEPVGITTAGVIDMAIQMANAEGVESVSIRKLAAALDLAPMSLYGFFNSKDDLLDQMAACLLDKFELPILESSDWGDQIRGTFHSLYDLLMAQPSLVRLLATRRVVSLGMTRQVSSTLTHLARAGFSPEQSVQAQGALYSYTLGAVDYRLRRTGVGRLHPEGEDAMVAQRLQEFASARDFPLIEALADDLSTVGNSADFFYFGLDRMIDGLRVAADNI